MTVECKLIVTNFLNLTFNLKSTTNYLDRKPDNELLLDMSKHFHHPPSIIN